MTAPISNEPTTTRLHHYAGRYLDKWWIRAPFLDDEGNPVLDLSHVRVAAIEAHFGM